MILRILNRLGNSISDDEVKSLETEFAFSAEKNDCDAPDGINLLPHLGTGLAWDSYDVNMEMLNGKDTLHATVGICYQNITSTTSTDNFFAAVADKLQGRKRRQFSQKEQDIEPYYKQLKKSKFEIGLPIACESTSSGPLRLIDF